jgi:hypothetical protein
VAGGIVQFEATEGNGDELAGKPVKSPTARTTKMLPSLPKMKSLTLPIGSFLSFTTGINLSASAR